MKILLVNPPRSPANQVLDHAPPEARRFVHRKLVGPPLGLLTISASVPDHDVRLLELKGEYDLDPDAPEPSVLVRKAMEEDPPDLVGTTFIASEFDAGIDILKTAKAVNPDVPTVAGGLHATLCPGDFDDPAVDVVLPGDANKSFPALVRALEAGDDLDSIGGIMFRTDEGLRKSSTPPIPCDPAGRDFLVPERFRLDRWRSTYHVGGNPMDHTYLYTSLGCTSRCAFCSIWPQRKGAFLQRDVESVIDELKALDDYGVVRFADANTVVDIGWTHRLLDRMEEEGIHKFFVMDLRMDTAAAHPRLVERLARAGLKVVITGVESPRQKELKRYNKQLDTDQIREGLRVCHENGIMLRANYVIPPDYLGEDFDQLAGFAARNSTAYAGYTILTPMPGTELFRRSDPDIVDRDLSKYNFFNLVLRTSLPREEFLQRVGSLWEIRTGTHVLS